MAVRVSLHSVHGQIVHVLRLLQARHSDPVRSPYETIGYWSFEVTVNTQYLRFPTAWVCSLRQLSVPHSLLMLLVPRDLRPIKASVVHPVTIRNTLDPTHDRSSQHYGCKIVEQYCCSYLVHVFFGDGAAIPRHHHILLSSTLLSNNTMIHTIVLYQDT